jgi:uncharacterized protein YoxC
LDNLTQEEAKMASAEQLKMTHSIDGKVMGVDNRVRGVERQVQGVRGDVQDVRVGMQDIRDDVQDVHVGVQGVRVDVQDVRGGVRDVGNKVQDIDDRLDQASRSLYFKTLVVLPRAQTASQGTNSEIVSYDGFRPQIHPQIITLSAKLITTAQLDGFPKGVYSITGNLLAPSCGYMENVRYSQYLPYDDP